MHDRNAILEALFNWIYAHGLRAYAVLLIVAVILVGSLEAPS